MRVRHSRRGGILLGLLISAVVAVCLIAVVGVYVASHVRIVSHDRTNEGDVSIELPGGNFSVRAHGRQGLGVAGIPAYPGSHPDKYNSPGSAVVQWSSNHGKDKGFAVEASSMVTEDSVDKVADYYRRQLPNWIFESKRNGGFHMELQEGGYKRMIEIHDEHGQTHIGVASVGEPASN